MDKLTAGYEKLIKGKQVDYNNKDLFDKAIKTVSKPDRKATDETLA